MASLKSQEGRHFYQKREPPMRELAYSQALPSLVISIGWLDLANRIAAPGEVFMSSFDDWQVAYDNRMPPHFWEDEDDYDNEEDNDEDDD